MFTRPHRRLNRLTGEWLLVSPQRTDRPWQGQVEKHRASTAHATTRTATCAPATRGPAAPGTRRIQSTYVFDNDFPALLPDVPPAEFDRDGLLVAGPSAASAAWSASRRGTT